MCGIHDVRMDEGRNPAAEIEEAGLSTGISPGEPSPEYRSSSQQQGEARVQSTIQRFVMQRPLVAIGGAVVAGFIVGRILSRT